MGQPRTAMRNRPTSAIEKTRSAREGGAKLRPSSAGMWRGDKTAASGKDLGLVGDDSEDSATTHSSMSRSTQRSTVQGRSNGVPKTARPPSSRSSSVSSQGIARKPDVWIMAPLAPTGRADDPTQENEANSRCVRGGSDSPVFSERLRKLSRLPSEKDRHRLQQMEEAQQAALREGGRASKAYLDILEKLVRRYNSVAMHYLQQGEHKHALDLLQSAESLVSQVGSGQTSFDTLKGLTYNNLGCYFRREGMPMEALKWLRQAHDIEQRGGEDSARSSTFLNLCAVYSVLGKHLEALQCATQALKHLKAALQRNPDASLSAAVPGMEKLDTASMLSIAYHNIAVEQEYLQRYDEAVSSYRKALQVAQTQCGQKSQLAGKIRLALAAAVNAARSLHSSTTLDTETSVSSLESRPNAPQGNPVSRGHTRNGVDEARRQAGREWDSKPSWQRENTGLSAHERGMVQRHREHLAERKQQDMTIESLSESGSASGRDPQDARANMPVATGGGSGEHSSKAGSAVSEGKISARPRVSAAGRGAGGKGDNLVMDEHSWGSERSPESGSSKERNKRPLSAARLPATENNSSQEGPSEPAADAVRRHSRKTARPRTAGRERMADQDREELLAMTDPSSSDGEYEAVADDAGLSEGESQAASRPTSSKTRSGRVSVRAGQDEAMHGEGSVIGGKFDENAPHKSNADHLRSGRPMSASRPPEAEGPWKPDAGQVKSRTSRKTARPRTAGRERMRETDREDLLVLSSGSEDAYEYLDRSDGDDDPSRQAGRVGERAAVREVRGIRVEREGEQVVKKGAGKRQSNRPLSAGVSFNSPSNVVHLIRPQSAPAVRRDGRPAGRTGHLGEEGQEEEEGGEQDEEEQEDGDRGVDQDTEKQDEDIFDSDEGYKAPHAQRRPFQRSQSSGRIPARPRDSGQRRTPATADGVSAGVPRPAARQPPAPAVANSSGAIGHKGAPVPPYALHESDDEADEEELDTKGILLQQTEVLTAELERAKQRESELFERISRLEQAPSAAGRLPLPPVNPQTTVSKPPLRRLAFGLPEVGLDGVDAAVSDTIAGQQQPPKPKKLSSSAPRGLPPRPSNRAGQQRALPVAAEPLNDYDEICELTTALRSAAEHKARCSIPNSPARSTSSSAAATGMTRQPAHTHIPNTSTTTVTFDSLRAQPPSAGGGNTWMPREGPDQGGGGGGARSMLLPHDTPGSATTPGDLSDSSRASSVSRPVAALQPLPASRRRRQRSGNASVAQLQRAAAQVLQCAWRAHLARARAERRRALARRRAAKAHEPAHVPRRGDGFASVRRDEGSRGAPGKWRKSSSERGYERPSSTSTRQQQPGGDASQPVRVAGEEKRRRRAAVAIQGVVRGWSARRMVTATMDWSLVREAASAARTARGRARPVDRDNANPLPSATTAWDSRGSAGEGTGGVGGLDDEVLFSTGTNMGRATPLHSVGVAEESLEGLLQDLGL